MLGDPHHQKHSQARRLDWFSIFAGGFCAIPSSMCICYASEFLNLLKARIFLHLSLCDSYTDFVGVALCRTSDENIVKQGLASD